MIRKLIKTLLFGTVAFYAARKVAADAKILRIRSEAQIEMDRLEETLKQLFAQSGEFADLDEAERTRLWDIYFQQHNKWTKVHSRTF